LCKLSVQKVTLEPKRPSYFRLLTVGPAADAVLAFGNLFSQIAHPSIDRTSRSLHFAAIEIEDLPAALISSSRRSSSSVHSLLFRTIVAVAQPAFPFRRSPGESSSQERRGQQANIKKYSKEEDEQDPDDQLRAARSHRK
jgi:hypothetical protein